MILSIFVPQMLQLRKSPALYTESDLLRVALFLVISLLLASCGAGKTTVSRKSTSSSTSTDVLDYSRKYLGKPYRYAGKGPHSFDCSGFTSFVFKEFGYQLNASSAGQDKQLPHIADKKKLQKGDLVFFEGRRRNGKVGHVGIVSDILANGDFRFIHASTTSGVIISSSREPYYASRYLRGGRIIDESKSLPSDRQKPSILQINNALVSPATLSAQDSDTRNAEVIVTSDRINNSGYSKPTILVQTDSTRNHPLTDNQQKKRNTEDKTVLKANTNVVLREESAVVPPPSTLHTVKMGETLYSISIQHGCTVIQLRALNPRLGTTLKTGEVLYVPVAQ